MISLKTALQKSIAAKEELVRNKKMLNEFEAACEVVVKSYENGGSLLIAGNGGSAADAQHLAAEFVSKLNKDRAALPALSLTTDTSILTAIGNDYGFEYIFSRQIEANVKAEDVFLGITTSGNSRNILKALEKCKELEIPSIVFSGRDGGAAKKLADFCIIAPGESTNIIQEIHICMCHTLCATIEQSILGVE